MKRMKCRFWGIACVLLAVMFGVLAGCDKPPREHYLENDVQYYSAKDPGDTQPQSEANESAEAAPGAENSAVSSAAKANVVADVNVLKDGKYLLRYVWRKGDILAWEVTHRNRTVTTLAKLTESVDASCRSEKVWEVIDVDENGVGTFTNAVPWAVMREKRDDGAMRTYDSQQDMFAPEGFEAVPESLGVELAKITLDARGRQVDREDFRSTTIIQQANQAYTVIPFPEEPVAVGGSWDFKYPLYVPLGDGNLTRVEMMQKYTLRQVNGDVATIAYGTKVLSPVQDPGIMAQLIDRLYDGTYQFNLKAGHAQSIAQKVDQSVIGFRGVGSQVKMLIEFNEKFLAEATKNVSIPAAGNKAAGPRTVTVPQTPEGEQGTSLQEVPLPPGVLENLN